MSNVPNPSAGQPGLSGGNPDPFGISLIAAKEAAARAAAHAPVPAPHMASFGPNLAALSGGYFGTLSAPGGLGSLGPGLAGAIASLPPYVPPPQPPGGFVYTPPTAVMPLSAMHAVVASAGPQPPTAIRPVPPPIPPPTAVGIVGAIVSGANAGDPVSILNALQMDLAQRLQIQASYVERFVGPAAVGTILAGNFGTLPLGTGKYDPNLPLVLEEAVDAMIANPNSKPADLNQFSAALYQVPAPVLPPSFHLAARRAA